MSADRMEDYLDGKLSTTDGQFPKTFDAGVPNPTTDPVTGQHAAYWVLSPAERAKGFVRSYRDAYKHLTCGTVTTMGRALSETYAAKPDAYGSTFCVHCKSHFPVGENGEFMWMENDGTYKDKVGT